MLLCHLYLFRIDKASEKKINICNFKYIYIYIYMYVCMYVCIYVYIAAVHRYERCNTEIKISKGKMSHS